MTAVSESGSRGDVGLSTIERIRRAALANFAVHGIAATSLRAVAAAAGVSLGLVQHHFATKAGLIKAVDDYVLESVIGAMSQPLADAPSDTISDIGSRVTQVIAQQPEVAGYVGRAMVDGSPLGATLFDALMDVGMARWAQRVDRGDARPDVDVTWATINAMVLALGAISLRAHVDRHLPEPFATPAQLQRWQDATDSLLRDGLIRHPTPG